MNQLAFSAGFFIVLVCPVIRLLTGVA